MRKMDEIHGRISGEHFHGIGTVTRHMVTERAKEIGRINGRDHFIEDDWRQARRELTGIDSPDQEGEMESIPAVLRWDEEPGTSGHRVPNVAAPDEQTFAEHLVEEGVNEAEHEQMVEGSQPEPEEET